MSLSPIHTTAWQKLERHRADMESFNLRVALDDVTRHAALNISAAGLHADFSKHLATSETLALLLSLAREMNVEAARDAMLAGDKINLSEDRAVLHTALRATSDSVIHDGGNNVVPEVQKTLQEMDHFSTQVRSATYKGYTGKAITDIVHIGIGGSDLGPRFVIDALRDFAGHLRIHFVSNVDGSALAGVLEKIEPETSLFIIASKTFTTAETLLNARTARAWFIAKVDNDKAVSRHFIGLSANVNEAKAFGIDTVFPLWDWVGGRYSLWSAIGLPIMLAIGADNFRALLAGARDMDTHFKTAPLEKNMPVLMAMLGVWYRNFWNYPAHLILPYDDRLGKMAKYIQQMDMESNGKAVCKDGKKVAYETAPFIFGEPGTDSQHSYMQLVHQGTTPVPVDFVACIKPHHGLKGHHESLLSNCLAQSRALAIGLTLEEAGGDPFRVFTGNRPSTTFLLPELTPHSLGALIAAYEHKVFVQGIIWNINSFDQPGVELGKKLTKLVQGRLESNAEAKLDLSTEGLLSLIKR